MNDNTNDDNPSHIAVKQVSAVNHEDELAKDKLAFGDTGDDSILGGDASGNDFGDSDPNDPDAGGVENIDESLKAVGLQGDDENGPRELGEDALNTNTIDDISTARADDADELDEAA